MVRRADQRAQAFDRIDLGHRRHRCRGRGRHPGPVVFRRRAGQLRQLQIGLGLVAMQHQEPILGDGFADHREVEIPFGEDRLGLGLLLGAEHHQHALLAFAEHHLIGGHRGLAHRHPVQIQPDPQAALVAHLDRRAGQPRSTHVLDRDHRARGHQFQTGFQQAFLGERVADLHGGALVLDGVVEFGAGHGGAAHPVAAGLGAEIDHRHADAAGGGIEDRIGAGQPGGEGIDQAVAVIGAVEPHLAAHGRHAEGVAIGADPLDHALAPDARSSGGPAGRTTANSSRRSGARPW